jgi:hypothetical protein
MQPIPKDPDREERISMEITVDAYGPEEQAISWYYYLEEALSFPFSVICCQEKQTSPLRMDDKVKIFGMASEEVCEHNMLVEIRWKGRTLAIPLAQVKPVETADEKTKEAVADWHYWVDRGYEL